MKSRVAQFMMVILAVALFVFVTLPAYRDADALRKKAADNEQTLALSTKLKQNRDDLLDRFNRVTDAERENLRRLLPDTLDNVRLVNDISDIAAFHNLKIRDIAVGDQGNGANSGKSVTQVQTAASDASARKQRYGTLTLSFSTTATYGDFASLLRELERSLRLVDVRSVTIKSSPGRAYEFSVVLETYWLR